MIYTIWTENDFWRNDRICMIHREQTTFVGPDNDMKIANHANETRSHFNGSKHKLSLNNNKHIRSSTFGSHDLYESPRPSNTNKSIKLFYRFGTKSYPPIICKTTNTI